jgi:hypothetical protein
MSKESPKAKGRPARPNVLGQGEEPIPLTETSLANLDLSNSKGRLYYDTYASFPKRIRTWARTAKKLNRTIGIQNVARRYALLAHKPWPPTLED